MSQKKNKISIQIAEQLQKKGMNPAQLKPLVRFVCRRFHIVNAAVQVSLVDDAAIKSLHKRFFNTAKTTDVISFDLSDSETQNRIFDIVINLDQAERQAAKRGHSVLSETALYLVHGMLHQLGFDDLTDAEAGKMHRKEDGILMDAGFGAVYQSTKKGTRV